MEIKKVISNNVNTTLIKTDKFKTILFQIVFLGEFSKENATKRSLLSRLLTVATKKYPNKKTITNRLMDLYDASLSITTYPSYKTSITIFSLDIVNQNNLPNKTLTKDALAFLNEVIFNPNIEDGLFSKKDFLEQKRILGESIRNIYNNKNRYALRQMLNKMAPNEIISVSSIGNIDGLEKIKNSDLVNLYYKLIKEENVSIYVVGDFQEEEILEDLKILGNFSVNEHQYPNDSNEEIRVEKVREFSEKQEINQTKLMMGLRTNVSTISPDYIASMVFNTMFGGMFISDLTRVVREENSLAYYIASQIINEVKLLIISAGIDQDKYQMTTDLVIKELENYKEGRIDSDLLKIAQDYLHNQLIEIEDSAFALSSFEIRNYLHNLSFTIPKMMEAVKNINLSDVQRVAQGIFLDTIFLLTSED